MGIIEKLFPRYVLRRDIARLQLENIKRAYEAGSPRDFHKVVVGSQQSANTNMEQAGVRMRSRARYFDENHDIVTGILDTLVLNVVGNSNPIRPLVRNPDGTLNSAANETLLKYWSSWSLNPTLGGGVTMIQALKLACRAWLRDGEFLTRYARGSARARLKSVPLMLELIDADYLPFGKERVESGKSKIIQGVEINTYNQAIAYHLLKDHPENVAGFIVGDNDTKRIPAAEMIHLKYSNRIHQVRGVTLLHSVLNRLDDLKDYEESERIAARVAAAWTGYIKKPGEQMGGATSTTGDRAMEMSPGMIFDNLLPGEEIATLGSNRPNPELVNFRDSMLRAIAAGTRTNASTISRNYDGTYSSQRQELLEAKPGYEGLRQSFVDGYLGPIWREFVKMLQVAGTIDTKGIDPETIDNVEIRGIDIGWIDPQKQANATETAIRTGITTRGQVIRDQGGDPAAVFAEIDEEKERFGDLIPYDNNQETSEGENDADEQDEQD